MLPCRLMFFHSRLFLLSFFFLLRTALTVDNSEKRCVTLFESEPKLFDVCRTNECFVFRTEIPIIWTDDSMNTTTQQQPFPCANYSENYPGLYGPFFDIVNILPPLADAQCVWGGTDCLFDDMVKFVQRTSRGEGGHKFVAGGLLFNLAYRMSPQSIPSVPLLEDKLIIIGPRNDDRATWANAWEALWRPFTAKAWALLILTFVSTVFLRVWISYHFTIPFNWQHFRDNLVGDYVHSNIGLPNRSCGETRPPRHRDPAELRRLNSYISNGVKLLFILVLLYYEISVVDYVFQDRHEEVDHVSPETFAITENSTMDRVFVQEFLNNSKNPRNRGGCARNNACWFHAGDIQDVYDTITDRNSTKSDRYRYSYVYEVFNRYWFKENSSLCQELQVLEYDKLARSFAGVWYYSSNINLTRRDSIDRSILALREKDEVRKKIFEEAGYSLPPKCETSTSISVLFLGVPLSLLPGPIFTMVMFYMVLYTFRWRRDRAMVVTETQIVDDVDDCLDGDSSEPPSLGRKPGKQPPYVSQITVTTCSESSGTEFRSDYSRFETLTRRTTD